MNEFVWLVVEPSLMRNSLILIGLAFRTFSAAVSECFAPAVVHEAFATRSPLNADEPEVTLNVALTVAPGATVSVEAGDVFAAVHPLGTERLNWTPAAGAPVVFVNVMVVSCDVPGANVWSPGGVAVEDAGDTI